MEQSNDSEYVPLELANWSVEAGPLVELPANGLYHVVVLSNFARAFDKYSRIYDKSAIVESTFPNQFFVLKRDELEVGVTKASRLLDKIGLDQNRLLLLRLDVDLNQLRQNTRTGLGQFVKKSSVPVAEVFIASNGKRAGEIRWIRSSFETASNESLKLLYGAEPDWGSLTPRSISVLPVALGCQAKCDFCFSHASISEDQNNQLQDVSAIRQHLRRALNHGAVRAVITGGGEPGLLPFDELIKLVKLCSEYYAKVILISNGYSLARLSNVERLDRLGRLHDAGLSVLSISRHHHLSRQNESIMHLDTRSDSVAKIWASNPEQLSQLNFRWVCVLQKSGVASIDDVEAYIIWSFQTGVRQVCFKELYVSTSSESVYYDSSYNTWSRENQIPLKVVLDWAEKNNCEELFQLPWGSPVFRCERDGRFVDVAAYTEPSVYWELGNGICRSWNVMADGLCYASLEDRNSLIRERT